MSMDVMRLPNSIPKIGFCICFSYARISVSIEADSSGVVEDTGASKMDTDG
jgi:hypothetical protein